MVSPFPCICLSFSLPLFFRQSLLYDSQFNISIRTGLISTGGKPLASASNGNTVRLWDRNTGASRGSLKGHSKPVTAVPFSPEGKLLASASIDKRIQFWDPNAEPCVGASKGIPDQSMRWHSRPMASSSLRHPQTKQSGSGIRIREPRAGPLRGI